MRKMLANIIEEAAAAKTRNEKIQVLVKNDHPALRIILCLALHPGIEWELPRGKIDYKPNELPFDQEGVLYAEIRRLYLFMRPNHVFHTYHDLLPPEKRKILFIQLLEMVAREDALLLMAAKDKKLHVKGLPPAIVESAFPGIISQPPVEKLKKEKENVESKAEADAGGSGVGG